MYLSKLEIIGFKSFAQKVGVTFDAGMSAIVGPNGCGKTNIVDAIRWVLGEQRYSALRSDKMEDVIFNGTKTRKPLGMAEASLVIENTKGILPSEYTQVTIGRRVYRSGESEYLLNKVPCRLKDILDLFMDTGMGSDAYSVIELKMIETILSDRAEERRRLFEEAAGVTKYKHRRKAAYRKLEDVRADLTRVNDIVAEVQKAVNSLERQARKAEQFNELKTRLRTLEVDLMEREYAQLQSRIGPIEEKLSLLQVDRSRIDGDLSQGETRLETLRNALLEAEKRLAEAQRDVSLQRERAHRVEQDLVVASERISALNATAARANREKGELEAELERLGTGSTTLTQRIAELEVQSQETSRRLAVAQEELRAHEAVLDAKKKDLQVLNERTIALVHEVAERQTELEKTRGRADNLDGRAQHAAEEAANYGKELERLDEQINVLSVEDRTHRRAFAEAEMRLQDAEERRKQALSAVEELQMKVLDLRGEIERKTARIAFLKGLVESREGMSEGVRFLSGTDRWKPAKVLTVADAVHAEERLRAALEAALGEFANWLVVPGADDVDSAVRLLKEEDRGKASFLCLDRVPTVVSRRSLPGTEGVVGWASELAQCDEAYAGLFRYLLDGVLIVESNAAAAAASARLPGLRCVTLDGEVETGSGVRRGGSRRVDEGGTIGKQQQIDDLHEEVRGLQRTLEEHEAGKVRSQQDHDAIDLKAHADAVKAAEREMNAVEVRIAQVQFEKKRAGDIIARSGEQITALNEEAKALRAEVEAAEPALASLRREQAEVERTTSAASAELEVLEEQWNAQSEAVRELRIDEVRARNDLANALQELERAGRRTEEIHAAMAKRGGEAADAVEATAAVETSVAGLQIELETLTVELQALNARREEEESHTAEVREEMHRIELAIKDQRRTHDDSLRVVHEQELLLQDLRAKSEHLVNRAHEEFDLLLELKSYPEDEFVDFASLREEIPALRDKIRGLGNINFAAFEEYTQEKQRFETLEVQRNDLLEGEKNLLATIEEINTTAQRQFLDTFAQIRTNFIDTFKSLFDPGDECDLKLEEEVDPLEARIEIVAKPRGKRPTSIDLLSGGEKTLTAIALLFAIYLVKPSPFCILDEVDAPLDDANVDRFTRILRKFSDNTQFIVVTHNKRTMEAANALYGVTMEEEGVSKVVTVRFNQGGTVTSAALAAG